MRAPSLILTFSLAGLVLGGCGWRTGLLIGDGSVTPTSDLGPMRDGGPVTDFGPLPDFGPPPIDFGPPDFSLPDFGPPDLGRCSGDAECDDHRVCNGFEMCVGGMCLPGRPIDCGDSFLCTNDTCAEPTGMCTHTPDSSRCPPPQICSPTRGCITMTCPTGGCDDGVFCDGPEVCGPDGLCHPGPPPCGPPGPCGPFCDEASHGCAMMIVDLDGDGFPSAACGGGDCNDSDPTVHPGAVEICNDGRDNNCDGPADCMDPSCFGSPSCGCVPRPEICDNGVDDDCNTLIDCGDPSCLMMTACTRCIDHELTDPERRDIASGTNIGAPNRFNPVDCGMGGASGTEVTYGWTATFDSDYVFDTIGSTYDTVLYVLQGCGLPNIPGACDDDGGGGTTSQTRAHLHAGQHVVIVVDAWSSGQVGTYFLSITPVSSTSETGLCRDGIDNDGDGRTDCADSDCASDLACCMFRGPEVCFNGIDDDCNALTDCADGACAGSPFCGFDAGPPPVDAGPPPLDGGPCTAHENTVLMCTNGRDDDCDTRIDCADPDCSPFGPMGECCNGRDDNGDGLIDEFTCRCFSDSDCAGVGSLEQVCWLTTFHVCAPRCDFVGGTAWCRMFFGAMATCNAMTGECMDAVLGGTP